MKIIELIKKTKKIVYPQSKTDNDRRREFILNIILFNSSILLAVASAITIIQAIRLGQDYRGISPLLTLAIFLILIFFLYLSRSGFFILISYLLVGGLYTLATFMMYAWGIELVAGSLFYILIIVISGILISTRLAFIMTAVLSLSVIVLGYLQFNNITSPDFYWKLDQWGVPEIIVLSVIFFIIATVSWLSNREIEKSLRRAIKSEAELKEERDMLEIRIEERTKELKKIQMEKMTQLSRFAEFGKLSSGLFHDLANPLTAVVLNIEKIKRDHLQDDNFKEVGVDLDRAIKATDRMREFIQSVRKQIAHQETREILSLNKEIEDALQILAFNIRKNQITVKLSASNKIETFGNPIKFNQVVVNLISNAIDACSTVDNNTDGNKNKIVEIDLYQKDKMICLSISDNGCGISKNIQHKIFEPFFTTKDFQKGTGIGLSLTKDIINRDFDGTIEVASEEGKGTRFTVKFPKKIN